MSRCYPPLDQTRAQLDELSHVPDCAVVGACSLVDGIYCDLGERCD
jgi:hypothetical protein